ncbi:hypothetical protein [Sphingobium sp. DN12]|uniref:hypothetical protein n=1 Tax=Sphingobium sp. DN12 TaxID=3378073 RepID=UPI003DA67492
MIVNLFGPWTIKGGPRKGQRVPGFRPVRWEPTWDEFVEALWCCAAIPTPRGHKMPGSIEVNAIGMADYPKAVNRSKEAALGADWIGFDIDDKGETADAWKFDDLVEFLDAADVAYAVCTTTSCTEERHCLRVFMPLDRYVYDFEWGTVWAAFAAWIGQIDPQTKDLSRIFFEPRLWDGAYNRFHSSPDGRKFVSVNDIVRDYAPPVAESPQAAPIVNRDWQPPADLRTVDDLTDFQRSPIIKPAMVDAAFSSSSGGRMFAFLCKVALSARSQSIALAEFELEEIGRRLAAMLGRRDISDIQRDAQRALSWSESVALNDLNTPKLPPAWPWSSG